MLINLWLRENMMGLIRKAWAITKQGIYNTFTDSRLILVFIIFVFIYDSCIRKIIDNAKSVGKPIGFLETFIFIVNSWQFLLIVGMGFLLIIIDTPKTSYESIFAIIRSGKKAWMFGEILTIIIESFLYLLMLLGVCILGSSSFSYVANVWSEYTVDFEKHYKYEVIYNNLYIEKEVYRFYSPYEAFLKSFLLMFLVLIIMGTIVLVFSIINKKLIGIIINMISIPSVLFFNRKRLFFTWLLPYPHAQLGLHNVYVLKKQTFPIVYSLLYIIGLEMLLVIIGYRSLKRKTFK